MLLIPAPKSGSGASGGFEAGGDMIAPGYGTSIPDIAGID
jgi:hypothetical protein